MKPISHHILTLLVAMATVFLSAVAAGQFDDPSHEFDPAATKAFTEMVDAHRKMPGLTVKSKVSIVLLEDDVEGRSDELEAEFVLVPQKHGIAKLRGFTVHFGGGAIHAVHEGNDSAYFTMSDDGSPYYALLAMFMDLPYPQLAIHLGEEDIEDLLMQFHSRAPWIRPTSVKEELRPAGRGMGKEEEDAEDDEDAQDDAPRKESHRKYQVIKLTSDFETMELVIDPKTKVIESLELTVTGGAFVQPGTTMIYRQTFDNTIHEKKLGDAELALDLGEREPVEELRALLPRPQVVRDGGGRRGVAPGGLVGKPAPPLTLATLDGGAVDLDDLRGQVVVIDFWATWCIPCRRGLQLLHELHAWTIERGLPVQIMTVNSMEDDQWTPDERLSKVAEFWQGQNFSLPVAIDFTSETAEAWNVRSIPSTFVIRSDGTVHAHHVGAGPDYLEEMKAYIEEALTQFEF